MAVHTNSQKMAQMAWEKIRARQPGQEFSSFARSFPAVVHSCGLAQAVAFAKSKERTDFIGDLAAVLQAAGHPELTTADQLEAAARTAEVPGYMRLSRNALMAAGWLKRYVDGVAGA